MRIPVNAQAYYPVEGGLKATGSILRAEPVDAGARSRTTLSGPPSGQAYVAAHRDNPQAPQSTTVILEDRRKGERRCRNQSVLLDTRVKERRREDSETYRISDQI